MSELAKGAWVAALTPLNDDLSIDFAAYRAHAEALFAQGAAGIVALGTTGEANSFSLDERKALIEHLGTWRLAPERWMIGVGCCAGADTLTLTRAALDAGLPNVLMLPPFYYKNVSDDGLFAAYARIIERIGDPSCRVIIYDIPPMTGFALSTDLLVRLRAAFPDIVAGVKNSSGDWSAMDAALTRLPGFGVFAGSEQFLLPTLRAGGPGCISAVANVNVAAIADIAARWREDSADARQLAVTSTRLALAKYPTIPALKEIMAATTGRARWRNLRPPLVNLADTEKQSLLALARELSLNGAQVLT